MNASHHSNTGQAPSKKGFTLTEVMVTLSLLSILVPPTLLLSNHLNGATIRGSMHANNVAESRLIQQLFVQKTNASKGFQILSGGDQVELSLYDKNTETWETAVLSFLEDSHQLVYFAPGATQGRILSEQAYRNNSGAVFTAADRYLRCNLYLGPDDPMGSDRGGIYKPAGVFLDLKATARNWGRINV